MSLLSRDHRGLAYGAGQARAAGALQNTTSCLLPNPGLTPSSCPAGTQLEKLMENMRNDIASHPPVEGSYAPRRGEFCIAKFVDGEW